MKETVIIGGQIFDCSHNIIEELGITPITLSRWTTKGRLPHPIKLGNKLFYSRKEVEENLLKRHIR